MTNCFWQRLQIEIEWKIFENRETWIEIENLRERFSRACVNFENFEFDRFANRWNRRIETWRNANLYEISKLWKRIWNCMCRKYVKTTIWFDVIANQMNSNFQRTCDVNHSRSDEILIENLKINDEMNQSTFFASDFDFLTEIHRFYFLLCFYSSFFIDVRSNKMKNKKNELKCHVENDRLNVSIEWRFSECQ